MRTDCIVVVAIAVLAPAGAAAADRVAVLPTEATAPPVLVVALEAVRAELTRRGVEVASAPAVSMAAEEIAGDECVEAPCARAVAEAVGAHASLVVRLEAGARRRGLSVALIPRAPSARTESDEASLPLDAEAPEIARAARRLADTVLEASGLGATEERSREPSAPRRSRGALWWLGWTGVATGLAVTSVGAALVAVDGRCATASQPTNAGGERYCPEPLRTETAGWASLGSGLAAAVAGVVLLVVHALLPPDAD